MTISRRDTILLAVLINVSLLALLFMTAIHDNDRELSIENRSFIETVKIDTPPSAVEEAHPMEKENVVAESTLPIDELDKAIIAFSNAPQSSPDAPIKETIQTNSVPSNDTVEIQVKRGDTLDKIAKANKTTSEEIRKINHLTTDKLSVGQKLWVPTSKSVKKKEGDVVKTPQDVSYYTIKSGDSPWKIAKQFNVSYEEILKLNNLTEEKARSLKIGEQIRIR